MNDEQQIEPSQQPPGFGKPRLASDPLKKGRCAWCGYQLNGLPRYGKCPECGENYTPLSATRLQPWPSVLSLCLTLGWPIIGLLFAGSLIVQDMPFGFFLGFCMLPTMAVNSYYRIRALLVDCLPEMKRTQGVIPVLRAAGTAVAAIVVILTIAPCILFGACVILFAGSSIH